MNIYKKPTSQVSIGGISVGGNASVRVQSMTNTDTNDIESSLQQIYAITKAGGEIVRLTAQGLKEVKSLARIKKQLLQQGIETPLVADIHFRSEAAFEAAKVMDKVRINPGNFVLQKKGEPAKEMYQRLADRFRKFLRLCREHQTAVRIGVNHGSLSLRILEAYGNTPQGMVASAIELLRIAKEEQFTAIICSLKSSSPSVMVESNLLLRQTMEEHGMAFPLHLGVTEAGAGEDGRIKSAVGISSLLCLGLGDTIRVSLAEPPEAEIPVARRLISFFDKQPFAAVPFADLSDKNAYFKRRKEFTSKFQLPETNYPIVLSSPSPTKDMQADFCVERTAEQVLTIHSQPLLSSPLSDLPHFVPSANIPLVVSIEEDMALPKIVERITSFRKKYSEVPIILHFPVSQTEPLWVASVAGLLLLNKIIDGLWVETSAPVEGTDIAFRTMQAVSIRITKPEFIACPTCGRTQFDLPEMLQKVEQRFAAYQGLKIAVMGCIVNGPGEMGEADYGVVGSGKGKVSVYQQQTPLFKNLPTEEAINRLEELLQKR